MVSADQVTAVSIFNQTYYLRGADDPDQVMELARFADERMREISEKISTVDPLKVAIMAILNILADYRSVRDELEGLKSQVSDQSERLTGLLETLVESD
jgi:cell division protein ZapA (FtsZ GTPase activity inhibitor)